VNPSRASRDPQESGPRNPARRRVFPSEHVHDIKPHISIRTAPSRNGWRDITRPTLGGGEVLLEEARIRLRASRPMDAPDIARQCALTLPNIVDWQAHGDTSCDLAS